MAKNGWSITIRKDPNTGQNRAVKILYRNGVEIEHHWLDELTNKKKEEQIRSLKFILNDLEEACGGFMGNFEDNWDYDDDDELKTKTPDERKVIYFSEMGWMNIVVYRDIETGKFHSNDIEPATSPELIGTIQRSSINPNGGHEIVYVSPPVMGDTAEKIEDSLDQAVNETNMFVSQTIDKLKTKKS